MILDVFDVEHGACALITTQGSRHILIDCGHNGTTGWQPGSALLARGISEIERLIVTNYDEDHVSGFQNLMGSVIVRGLQRNGNVNANQIAYLKSDDGIGAGVQGVADSFSYFSGPPLPVAIDDIQIASFSHPPGNPPFGFDDENNLSLVVFVTCGTHRIVFPGDTERAGWLAHLRNGAFVAQLAGVTIFVESHHGRMNGFCKEALDLCPNIRAFVVSDKKTGFQSQETNHLYRPYAAGFEYDGQRRHILTTRRDGSMRFSIPPLGGAGVWLGLAA